MTTNDIVARIRRENVNQRGHGHVIALAMEAADEVERLRSVIFCDHLPRLGVDVDPECARCRTLAPLRDALR